MSRASFISSPRHRAEAMLARLRSWRRGTAALLLAAAWPGLSGCRAVPIYDQHHVAKPSMQFSDSPVFAYGSRALTQIEPGFAASGGAQVTTCSACK